VVVSSVLRFNFVVRARNYKLGILQRLLFRFDALAKVEFAFGDTGAHAFGQYSFPLEPAQRMGRVEDRNAEYLRYSRGNKAAVGIVSVNGIRHLSLIADIAERVIDEFLQVWPELLFRQIAFGAARQTHNSRPVSHHLHIFRVIRGKTNVTYLTGQKFNPMHAASFAQSPQELQNILGLPSGISIHANLWRHRTESAMNTDVEKIKTSMRRRISCALLHLNRCRFA